MNEFALDDSHWISWYCLATMTLSGLIWLLLARPRKKPNEGVQEALRQLDKVRTRIE